MDMVQVAVAASVAEAEEIQTILPSAGIPSELHPAVEHHPSGARGRPDPGARARKERRCRPGRDRGADRARTRSSASTRLAADVRRSGRRVRRARRRYDELRPPTTVWEAVLDALVELGRLEPRPRPRHRLRHRAARRRARRARGAGCGASTPRRRCSREARRRPLPGGGFKQARAERLPFKDGLVRRGASCARSSTSSSSPRPVRRGARVSSARAGGSPSRRSTRTTSTACGSPASSRGSRRSTASAFPTPQRSSPSSAAAGFAEPETRRLTLTKTLTREEALGRLRGRFISTLHLLSEEELAAGIVAAERLPDRFETTLDWLVLAAEKPSG